MPGDSDTLEVSEPELVKQFLAGRDCPCPRCGYNLRDLTGDRCPECGDQLVLRVNVAEPRLAALITGLIALAAGAGLNGLLLIYGLIVLTRQSAGNVDKFFQCNGAGFVAEGGAIVFWLLYWKRLRRCSPNARWMWAAAACLLTLANLTYFTANVK